MLEKMQEIQPEGVTHSIRKQVNTYFAQVRKVFDEVEHEVMASIKYSSQLKSFLSSSEALTAAINDDVLDFIEDESQKLNEQVDENQFAGMILRHKFYTRLDKAIQKMMSEVYAEIAKIQSQEQLIFKIDRKKDQEFARRIREMVSEAFAIDGKPVQLREIQNEGASVIEECAFLLKDRSIMQVDLNAKRTREVTLLSIERLMAKLLPLSPERILVVGGQNGIGRNNSSNVVQRTVTEVRWDHSIGIWEKGIQHDYMKRMRVNFGATILRDGRVVVCGGNSMCY